VTRVFDGAGRLTSVADWLGNKSTFHYDEDGDLTGIGYANGVNGAFGYDHRDRVSSMDYRFLRLDYTRDNLGQVSRVDTDGQAGDENYSYTPIDQVSQAGLESFAYDPADNLARLDFIGQSYDAANELIHENLIFTSNLTYDGRGNRVQFSILGYNQTYRYDQANRLTGYGSQATYSYNGDGLRMRKVVSGVSRTFAWDLVGPLPLLLVDGTTQFIYGAHGKPLEQINPDGSVLWFHQDQLGSTRALTDHAGHVAARYGYSAYGVRPGIDPDDDGRPALTPLLFAGQYTDSESGLQYLRARYYDPATGQFLTRDPMNAITRSPYLYAGGNPVNVTDPAGMEGEDDAPVPTPVELPPDASATAPGTSGPVSDVPVSMPMGCDAGGTGELAWNPFDPLWNWANKQTVTNPGPTKDVVDQAQILYNQATNRYPNDPAYQNLANQLGNLIGQQGNLKGDLFETKLNGIIQSPNNAPLVQRLQAK